MFCKASIWLCKAPECFRIPKVVLLSFKKVYVHSAQRPTAEYPTGEYPSSASRRYPSSVQLQSEDVSLQCPTASLPCPTAESQQFPTWQSIPAVPSLRYPSIDTVPSPRVFPQCTMHGVFLQCPTRESFREYRCSAQAQGIRAVPAYIRHSPQAIWTALKPRRRGLWPVLGGVVTDDRTLSCRWKKPRRKTTWAQPSQNIRHVSSFNTA